MQVMKQLAILLLAFGFVFSALGQALPYNPTPWPLPDPAWSRLQSLVNGQPIVVDNTNGPPVHCFFAGVNDAYLFCNPRGNPQGVGFRFDHADVLGVDLDLPRQTQTQVSRPEHNYHPAWISSMIAGGIIVGLCATRSTDAGTATEAGFIGAGVVGLIGAPLAFLPHPEQPFAGPVYPQYGIGVRFRTPSRPRSHGILGIRPQH
jgi:hypothetical protein